MTNFCLKKQKLTELENKIPDVSNLATNTALTAVENKIPSVSSLVKKTNYDTKISELVKSLLLLFEEPHFKNLYQGRLMKMFCVT